MPELYPSGVRRSKKEVTNNILGDIYLTCTCMYEGVKLTLMFRRQSLNIIILVKTEPNKLETGAPIDHTYAQPR